MKRDDDIQRPAPLLGLEDEGGPHGRGFAIATAAGAALLFVLYLIFS